MISLTNWLKIKIIFLLLKFLIEQKQAIYIIETREHMTFYAGLFCQGSNLNSVFSMLLVKSLV